MTGTCFLELHILCFLGLLRNKVLIIIVRNGFLMDGNQSILLGREIVNLIKILTWAPQNFIGLIFSIGYEIHHRRHRKMITCCNCHCRNGNYLPFRFIEGFILCLRVLAFPTKVFFLIILP